ncbi:MAG: cyclase family protein [Terriglobales bacterium]
MRTRSFIIAYALVLAILLFADRRPGLTSHDRYSHVADLTDGTTNPTPHAAATRSKTRIIAPAALIPGTWTAGQIPPERLVAPLVILDLKATVPGHLEISLDDIAAWESSHGMIPPGAVVAVRRARPASASTSDTADTSFPIARDAVEFLMDARSTIGFAVETQVNLALDRKLAQQIALHGSYVLEGTSPLASLPATGSLVIVAPAKDMSPGETQVRILAMIH